jgi:PPK2 family polyphosphate:nucleotide phosphotransferase
MGVKVARLSLWRHAVNVHADRFLVEAGSKVRLRRFDPADTRPFHAKEQAEGRLAGDVARLSDMQELLYAEQRWALLLVFQAMDAAGKDSVIKHVMSGLNPQGTTVSSFKAPATHELAHDFLWRVNAALPERGSIGVFNRSHYEEVLVVRVHPEFLDSQRLPAGLVSAKMWEQRYEDINAFERHLARSGTIIRKFFLHVSRDEQRRRFLERLDEPAKNWKFSTADIRERERWDDYMAAYEDMLSATSTKHAPWYVIPADHKWFTHLAVARIIIEALESLHLAFPEPDAAQRGELQLARRRLAGGHGRTRHARKVR